MNRNANLGALPPLNQALIVFKYDRRLNLFDTHNYYTGLTDERLSVEELNHFLDYICSLISTKSSPNKSRFNPIHIFVILMLVCLGVGIVIAIVFYIKAASNTSSESSTIDVSAYKIFVAAIVIAFVIAFGCALRIYLRMNKNSKTRKLIESFIQTQEVNFAERGLRWNVPIQFPRWIELWKDYIAARPISPEYTMNNTRNPEELDESAMPQNNTMAQMVAQPNYNQYNSYPEYARSNRM
jgi:hypothetical protein